MFGAGQNTKGEQNLKSNQRFAKRLQHLKHLIMCSVKTTLSQRAGNYQGDK